PRQLPQFLSANGPLAVQRTAPGTGPVTRRAAMPADMPQSAPTLIDLKPDLASVREAVLDGLGSTPKCLPPWLFYDAEGSRLFERICEQPEYYPTRTELSILRDHGADIARTLGEGCTLVELGSGSHRKAAVMLKLLRAPDGYIAI